MASYQRLWHGIVLGECDVAKRLHDWCLFRAKNDPLKEILVFAESRSGSASFCIQVPVPDEVQMTLPPIEAVFELEIQRIGNKHSVEFRWQHREGFPLPSIYGSITARRFGPFVAVTALGEYAKSTDAAGTLFDEALGNGLAKNTLRAVLRTVRFILRQKAQDLPVRHGSQVHSVN
jgi:hypothetical protein